MFLLSSNVGQFCCKTCAEEYSEDYPNTKKHMESLRWVTAQEILEDDTNPEYWDVLEQNADGTQVTAPIHGQTCENCQAMCWDDTGWEATQN